MDLVQVPQKVIKTLAERMPRAVRETESPLAVGACCVARSLEHLRQGHIGIAEMGVAEIAPHRRVTAMQPGHQDAPGRVKAVDPP